MRFGTKWGDWWKVRREGWLAWVIGHDIDWNIKRSRSAAGGERTGDSSVSSVSVYAVGSRK